MSADFLDSNILLYLAWNDDRKASTAERLLREVPIISAQVLNEVTNVLRQKRRLEWKTVDGFIEDLLPFIKVLPLSQDTNRSARVLAERHNFAWYDALIVASAIEGHCTRLLTEDMHHGQQIGGLTITNPFR